MSGRKASEVNSLLRNGEKTRGTSMNILDGVCKKAKKGIDEAKKQRENCEKEINKINFDISSDAKEEFSEVAIELENSIKKFLHEKQSELPVFSEKEYKDILSEYKQNDKKADTVREDLKRKINSQGRNDPWYCDDEYANAKSVQDEYKRLANRVSGLSRKCSQVESITNTDVVETKARLNRAKELRQAIYALEKQTSDIKEMRAKASDAKIRIQEGFDSISNEIASKFLQKEYNKLEKDVILFSDYDDEKIVQLCSDMISKISSFKNKLEGIYSEYLKEKEKVSTELNTLIERISNKVFSKPEDEFTGGEKEMYSLIEFLEKYGKDDFPTDIKRGLDKIGNLIESDKFDEASSEITEIENLISDARDYVIQIHENKMKTIFNMLSIEKAMIELNYDVNVIENEDGDDGYCIECKAGDECITFDKVTVVEDGRPIITINHKESSKGTCAASWHTIRQKFSDEGLFLEDISKNGHSIHAPNTAQKKNSKNENRKLTK